MCLLTRVLGPWRIECPSYRGEELAFHTQHLEHPCTVCHENPRTPERVRITNTSRKVEFVCWGARRGAESEQSPLIGRGLALSSRSGTFDLADRSAVISLATVHIMASGACRHARVLARPAGAALNSAMPEASSAMTQEQVCYRELGTVLYRAYYDGAIDTGELHIAADSLSAHYRKSRVILKLPTGNVRIEQAASRFWWHFTLCVVVKGVERRLDASSRIKTARMCWDTSRSACFRQTTAIPPG